MKVYKEMLIEDFQPWCGAKERFEDAKKRGRLSEIESLLEAVYPQGCTETDINDYFWFQYDEDYGYGEDEA